MEWHNTDASAEGLWETFLTAPFYFHHISFFFFFLNQPSIGVVFKISFVNRPPYDEGATKRTALTAHAQYDDCLWAVFLDERGWKEEAWNGWRGKNPAECHPVKNRGGSEGKGQNMSNGTKSVSFQRDCTGQINRLKRETRGAKRPREDNRNRNLSMTECVRGRAPNSMETSQQRKEGVVFWGIFFFFKCTAAPL